MVNSCEPAPRWNPNVESSVRTTDVDWLSFTLWGERSSNEEIYLIVIVEDSKPHDFVYRLGVKVNKYPGLSSAEVNRFINLLKLRSAGVR